MAKTLKTRHNKKSEKTTGPSPQRNISQPNLVSKIPGWMIPGLIAITVLAYIPVFSAGFVNWDDGDYVLQNPLIRDFSTLKQLLIKPVQGNYHPLTMLSLAINYAISGTDAISYHVVNLLLHLINSVLAFFLAYRLFNSNSIIAFSAALIFAIHPMHVESVAWISERKDVLYGLFFLAGLISYVKYIDQGSRKHYYYTLMFLVLSLLSKPAAVIFPVTLFSIDLLRGRSFRMPLFIEKIPFFIPAIILGVVTVIAQKQIGATDQSAFPLAWKILFGFYGIMMYTLKMFFPFKLSAFYSTPPINRDLSAEFYLGPVFFVLICVLFFIFFRKKRSVAFCISFFIINLLLVLQFFTVGSAVIAERYTYIPYFGLACLIGIFINSISNQSRKMAYFIWIPLVLIFGFLTFKQAAVWHSGVTLWENAISNQPSAKAYANVGMLYAKDKKFDMALDYYYSAKNLNYLDVEVLTDLGNLNLEMNKPDSAYYYYRTVLNLKPNYYRAIDNLGVWHAMNGRFDSALVYFNSALKINPTYVPSYRNRGFALVDTKNYSAALKDFERFIESDPSVATVYNAMGTCYRNINDMAQSLEVINKAIDMQPQPLFFINRAFTYLALNQKTLALQDASFAKQQGVALPPELEILLSK